MDKITRVGVDLAKRVIQAHAVDAGERVVAAKAMSRERFEAWCAQLPRCPRRTNTKGLPAIGETASSARIGVLKSI